VLLARLGDRLPRGRRELPRLLCPLAEGVIDGDTVRFQGTTVFSACGRARHCARRRLSTVRAGGLSGRAQVRCRLSKVERDPSRLRIPENRPSEIIHHVREKRRNKCASSSLFFSSSAGVGWKRGGRSAARRGLVRRSRLTMVY